MSTLEVCYDLQYSPPTYDITSSLCGYEEIRVRMGYDAINIFIAPGPRDGFRNDRLWPYTTEGRLQMLNRVAIPMCHLLPSVRSVTMLPDRFHLSRVLKFANTSYYGLMRQVEACRKGIRPLRPHGPIKPDSKLVTITLREAEHWPERNSQVSEWVVAGDQIEHMGFRVVFARDTLKAEKPLDDFALCSYSASVDLDARAQLYASALVNMGVSQGPLWMALAMDVPVLMLRPCHENLFGRTNGLEYFERCGIPRDGQMPGAPPWQRFVWEDDTTGNIVRAFERFLHEGVVHDRERLGDPVGDHQ
jgi:hypothetical protein